MSLALALVASILVQAPVAAADTLPVEVVGTAGTAGTSASSGPVGPVAYARLAPLAPLAPLALSPSPAAPETQEPFRYSAAYYRRLAIHRAASYAILPLFAFQFAAGLQLYEHGGDAPAWARDGHPIGAIGIASLFAVNGTTGVMNLWEGRRDPDRPRRTVVHGVMMLAAGAGFTATGFLASEAKRTDSGRDTHRAVAITSMAIATAGYLSMLELFR